MTPEDAERALDSPLRLVLVAELLERQAFSLRDAVLISGRHEQDVVAALQPLVQAGVAARRGDEFRLGDDLSPEVRSALVEGVGARRERLERERFVRSHVLGSMIGIDARMQLVFEAIRQVCRVDVAVLVTGETGSGKELVARAIHELGARRTARFEAVNCATLPASLFESHMFGHVRGAFTGAVQDQVGVFERVDGGTLFLDEIGELELSNQAKLLRVLQERTYRRVGDPNDRRSAFRLVAATHRDLPSMIASGTFREDLFYRCNVFPIRVPSLRERVADLPYLAEDVLRKSAAQLGLSTPPPVSEEALRALSAHRWPGNVRELENVLVRAAIASSGEPIRAAHLRGLSDEASPGADASAPSSSTATATLAQVEKEHVSRVLAASDGNLSLTAERLGIARATLYRMLKAHGIARPGARPKASA